MMRAIKKRKRITHFRLERMQKIYAETLLNLVSILGRLSIELAFALVAAESNFLALIMRCNVRANRTRAYRAGGIDWCSRSSGSKRENSGKESEQVLHVEQVGTMFQRALLT